MGERLDAAGIFGKPLQKRRKILEPIGDHVDHAGLVLQLAGDTDEPRAKHDGAEGFKIFGHTMVFATAVSSSNVIKITPLALPGRCRTTRGPRR